jgi:sirohydrochlorin cobalto/nickelchelatase
MIIISNKNQKMVKRRFIMSKEGNNFNSKNTGVLLISHGSRLPASSETINMLAEMYRQETDFKVEVGYMEIHKPNIPDALDKLVAGTQIDTVIAVPVFLAHGMHTTRDIPKILKLVDEEGAEENMGDDQNHNHYNSNIHNHQTNEENHNHESHGNHHKHNDHHHDFEKINFDGKILYTEPLGADPLVLEIIKNRVNTALDIK